MALRRCAIDLQNDGVKNVHEKRELNESLLGVREDGG